MKAAAFPSLMLVLAIAAGGARAQEVGRPAVGSSASQAAQPSLAVPVDQPVGSYYLDPEAAAQAARIPAPPSSPTFQSEPVTVTPGRFIGQGNQLPDPSGFTYAWQPDRWIKVGAGVKASYRNFSNRTPGIGGSYFAVDNARLLTSGQVAEYIGFELNADISNAQGLSNSSISQPARFNFLDGIVKFEMNDSVNFWVGQFLPPSDRNNLDGPFFINGWDFPFVQNYPAIFQGRELGAVYWGQLNEGQVKWSAGFFNGTGRTVQAPFTSPPSLPPNVNGRPLQFAGRVTVNFLDPEPGYYNQSTYYGKKDILAIGLAMQTQNDAVGIAGDARNFTGLSIDGLFDKKWANNGVTTLEGALYHYDNQDLATSSQQGDSGFVYAGYFMPQVWCLGKASWRFRPFTRYQHYRHDFVNSAAGQASNGVDIGTEAVFNGHNARLMAFWGDRDIIGTGNIQMFTLGTQVLF